MVVCTYSLFSRLEWHTPLTSTLVMEVRLPRMLLALFAGMGLTIAGQMFQIILNNPLPIVLHLDWQTVRQWGRQSLYFSAYLLYGLRL